MAKQRQAGVGRKSFPPTVLPAYTTAAKGTLSAPLLLYVHRLRLHGAGRGGWRERIQVQQSAQRKKKDYSYAIPCFGFFFLAAEKNALRLQRKGCRILCSRRETAARKRLLRVNAHGQLLSSPACKKGKWVDLVGRKGTKQLRERKSRNNPLQRNKCFSTWSKHTNKLGSGGRNWFGARRLFTPLFFFFCGHGNSAPKQGANEKGLNFREKRSRCRSRNRLTEILIAQQTTRKAWTAQEDGWQ